MLSVIKMKISPSVMWTASAVVVGAVGLKVVIPLTKIFFTHFIAKRYRSKRRLLKSAGEWAIITGGSAGIGKGFAFELAKEGLNILILSNDQYALDETCKEIEGSYPVKTMSLFVDFTKTDIYDRIAEVVEGLSTVACLVNNVGVSHVSTDWLTGENGVDCETIISETICNCIPTVCMTRIVLQKMLKQRTPGRTIINMSSYTAVDCIPLLLVYSATKSFVLHFSDCLCADLKAAGILVQSYLPYVVATYLSKAQLKWYIPDPATYAKSALDMLGVQRNARGYLLHDVYTFIVSFIPTRYFRRMCIQKILNVYPNQKLTII